MAKIMEHAEIFKNLSINDIDGEVWLDVDGYENFYQVSNLGRVKSLERIINKNGRCCSIVKCKILLQSIDEDGYLHVTLSRNSKVSRKIVHRLVGFHFIDNPENKPQINHKKGIKTDNRATELEWSTTQENIRHALNTGLRHTKITEDNVLEIRQMRLDGMSYKEIGEKFLVANSVIRRILIGESWRWLNPSNYSIEINKEISKKCSVGEKNGRCKLTENDVRKIRELRAMGMKQKEISSLFPVSMNMISSIITGVSWKHVP